MLSAATDQLTAILQASPVFADRAALSSGDREIIANGYQAVARNRDQIRYVTRREGELTGEAWRAYQALMATFDGVESELDAVHSYSSLVSRKVRSPLNLRCL